MLGPFIGPVVDFQNHWLDLKKKKGKIFKMTEKSLNQ